MPALLPILGLFLGLSALFASSSSSYAADDIYLDASQHSIAITTDFSGSDLLVFGSTAGPGDIVIVVRGPTQKETIWRRERNGGIWVNRSRAVIEDAPGFYWIGATGRLADTADPTELERLRLGLNHLQPRINADDAEASKADYWQAFLRAHERQNTYGAADRSVQLINGHLFRTTVHLPTALVMGAYTVEAYHLQNGRVIASATTPLVVTKAGFSARLARFAHQQSAAYAVTAILSAIGAGWLAAAAFRRA